MPRPWCGSPTEGCRLWWLAPGIVVFLVASLLRFQHLDSAPLHFDEATGARILAASMEEGIYPFTAHHFHGPALALLAEPIARLRGETGWENLTAETLRLLPAIAGSLLCLTPLLLRRSIGAIGALLAGLLLAVSPLLFFYSRVYIHEMLLALFSLLALGLAWQAVERRSCISALLAGLCLGLMWATKATFVIPVASWVASGALLMSLGARTATLAEWRVLLLLVLSTLLGICLSGGLLYSDFLREPTGLLEAIRTYANYEPVSGHEKPWFAHLQILLWPRTPHPLAWTQAPLLLAALTAAVLGWRAAFM